MLSFQIFGSLEVLVTAASEDEIDVYSSWPTRDHTPGDICHLSKRTFAIWGIADVHSLVFSSNTMSFVVCSHLLVTSVKLAKSNLFSFLYYYYLFIFIFLGGGGSVSVVVIRQTSQNLVATPLHSMLDREVFRHRGTWQNCHPNIYSTRFSSMQMFMGDMLCMKRPS